MAKKRKLRSSEPEAPEPQGQEPSQFGSELIDNIEEVEEEPIGMDVGEEVEGEEEEDQSDEPEGHEREVPEHEVPSDANGGGVGEIASGGDADDVADDDLEEEPVEKVLEPFSKEQLATLVKEAVEKYPEFLQRVQNFADIDPAHRKIFVHGLGWDASTETLVSEFRRYGEIEDCKAVTDKVSGKSKGYAFILFKNRSGARKALKEPQKKIGTRLTSCQLASAGPAPAPPPVEPPVSEYTMRKIFVSNVAAEIDPARLLEFFKQYGEIEDGPLGLDKQTGKPKGFALFVYTTAESAKKALEEPHKNFEGHTLHCQKAVDGPKQNKPFHHQHNQFQPHYSGRNEKSKYHSGGGGGRGRGRGRGHLMASSGHGDAFQPGPAVSVQGLNPVLGQALSALLATQGAGLGLNNLLGGYGGAPMNQGGPPVMGNAMYGNQAPGGSYDYQASAMPGGYQNPPMGQGGAPRPPAGGSMGGGPPYTGY